LFLISLSTKSRSGDSKLQAVEIVLLHTTPQQLLLFLLLPLLLDAPHLNPPYLLPNLSTYLSMYLSVSLFLLFFRPTTPSLFFSPEQLHFPGRIRNQTTTPASKYRRRLWKKQTEKRQKGEKTGSFLVERR